MEESRLIEGTKEIAKELKEYYEEYLSGRFSVFLNPYGVAFCYEEASWSTIQSFVDGDDCLFCGNVFRPMTARNLTKMINEERKKARVY